MKKIFLLPLLMLLCTRLFSQTTHDSIYVKQGGFGIQFYNNNRQVKMHEMSDLLASNAEATRHLNKARNNNTWANILGAAGGALIGFPLGTALGGGNPNWALAGIGAGLVVVSIPLSVKAKTQANRAAGLFNEGLRSTGLRYPVHAGLTGHSVALKISF